MLTVTGIYSYLLFPKKVVISTILTPCVYHAVTTVKCTTCTTANYTCPTNTCIQYDMCVLGIRANEGHIYWYVLVTLHKLMQEDAMEGTSCGMKFIYRCFGRIIRWQDKCWMKILWGYMANFLWLETWCETQILAVYVYPALRIICIAFWC